MQVIALNDENRLGTGTRIYLVLKRGRKWVRLLSLGCLRKITVAKNRAEHARSIDVDPNKIAHLLDRLVDHYRYRLGEENLAEIRRLKTAIHNDAVTH